MADDTKTGAGASTPATGIAGLNQTSGPRTEPEVKVPGAKAPVRPTGNKTEDTNERLAQDSQATAEEEGGVDYHTEKPTRELLDESHANVRDAKQAVAEAQANLDLAREQAAWDVLPVEEKERQLKVKEQQAEQAERDRVTIENLDEKMAASHPATELRKMPTDPGAPFREYDAEYNDSGDHRTRNVRVVGRPGPNQVTVRFENGFEKVVPENEVMEGGVPRGINTSRQGLPGV